MSRRDPQTELTLLEAQYAQLEAFAEQTLRERDALAAENATLHNQLNNKNALINYLQIKQRANDYSA